MMRASQEAVRRTKPLSAVDVLLRVRVHTIAVCPSSVHYNSDRAL
jgi:hypothetical protein